MQTPNSLVLEKCKRMRKVNNQKITIRPKAKLIWFDSLLLLKSYGNRKLIIHHSIQMA